MLAWDRTPSGAPHPTEIRVKQAQIGTVLVTLGNEFVLEGASTTVFREPTATRATELSPRIISPSELPKIPGAAMGAASNGAKSKAADESGVVGRP